jgi:heme A synthase
MFRVFFHYVLPLILPALIYVSYIWLTDANRPGWVQRAPWLGLFAAGAVLLAASLVAWGLLSGAEPGMTYVPPRFEDGRIVPGTFVDPDS